MTMTPRRGSVLLWLLLASASTAFVAFALPVDDGALNGGEERGEEPLPDSYASARDAIAGEDYFPSEPSDDYVYEQPPRPLPAIVYFTAGPALAQVPNGPSPLGPSKLANKVGEAPLPPRRVVQPPPPPPATRLVPALVLLLARGPAAAEPPRLRQLPPPVASSRSAFADEDSYANVPSRDVDEDVDAVSQEEGDGEGAPARYELPPHADAPVMVFQGDEADETQPPVPATEVRPPPLPETSSIATSDDVAASSETSESKESASTVIPDNRSRRSPYANSDSPQSTSSSSSSSSGSYASASSQSSSYGANEGIYFPGGSGSYSSSSSSAHSGAGFGEQQGFGGTYGGPGFGYNSPQSGFDNYGAGAAHSPQATSFGAQGGYGFPEGQGNQYGGYNGPAGTEGNLLNRFGSLDEPGPQSVQHSGSSTGKGVHSSASSSIDSTGKVTYHVQAGKF